MNFNDKSSVEIKKLFGQVVPGVNFLNTFTLDDIEMAKKNYIFNIQKNILMKINALRNI